MTAYDQNLSLRALLRWYAEQGVDEAVAATPMNFIDARADEARDGPGLPRPPARTVSPTRIAVIAPSALPRADEAAAEAARLAAAAATLDDLGQAVASFDGCALKQGARSTVFFDGVEDADLLVIGEGPGREEDLAGKPFVGRAGKLLDKMLATIGRSRLSNTLITNVVFWRPPGNRTPTQEEVHICRPFVDRLIEIQKPKAILLAGGAPTQALTGATGIMRARGAWRDVETAGGCRTPALPIFHPAFLLRQPAQKRLAWRDLQALAERLRGS